MIVTPFRPGEEDPRDYSTPRGRMLLLDCPDCGRPGYVIEGTSAVCVGCVTRRRDGTADSVTKEVA